MPLLPPPLPRRVCIHLTETHEIDACRCYWASMVFGDEVPSVGVHQPRPPLIEGLGFRV